MTDRADDPLAQVKAMRQAQLRACALKQAQELNQMLNSEARKTRSEAEATPQEPPAGADLQP